MSLDEIDIRNLLAVAMAYDNRNASDATVLAWSEAARRGRWDLPDAVEAVHRHYATGTAFLMPGHVDAIVKTIRHDRNQRFVRPEPIEQGAPEQVRELVAGAFHEMPGDTLLVAPAPNSAKARHCPHCQARPHEPCTRPSRGGPVKLRHIHPSRKETR